MLFRTAMGLVLASLLCLGQQTPAPSDATTLKQRPEPAPGVYQVDVGTRFVLNMINSVSTKQALVGDKLYLETAFPVVVNSHIVVPQGSWVTGTITEVKKPGRVKGRAEIQVRFDSLILPNGVTKVFRSDLAALDARSDEKLKREQSKVEGAGNKKGDTETVIGSTVAGGIIGSGIGAAAGHAGGGSVIGLGAGAAAGLIGVLVSRGPDAMLTKGSTVEMVLDRPLVFTAEDLDLRNAPPRATLSEGTAPATAKKTGLSQINPF